MHNIKNSILKKQTLQNKSTQGSCEKLISKTGILRIVKDTYITNHGAQILRIVKDRDITNRKRHRYYES